MNWKMDTSKWKEDIENAVDSTNVVNNYPYLVLNVEEPFDGFYGEGPFNMAFAYRDPQSQKWMSYDCPGEEISYHDFRDACNHNVGGHSGKVSHAIDAYEISGLILDLLDENETLKARLQALEIKSKRG